MTADRLTVSRSRRAGPFPQVAVIGPLSFVVLMSPYMSRLLGLHEAHGQLIVAALLGAGLMLLADWLSSMLMFRDHLPAGLLAAAIGGAYRVWGLGRRP